MPSRRSAKPEVPMLLRHQAEALLENGAAPVTQVATLGAGALTLLHEMASDPRKASAALKLLHELQVHQVELDLQREQLEQSREELARALSRLVERYERAPVGFLTVELDGRIIDANVTAAELLGVEQAALSGGRIGDLMTPPSRAALLGLLARLREGSARETCEVQLPGRSNGVWPCQIIGAAAPGAQSLLLVLIDKSDRRH